MAISGLDNLNALFCVLLLLFSSSVEPKNSKDPTTFLATNQSLASSSHRKGKFFFDELFGLNAGVGLSNDEDDDDDEDVVDNNVKTCNCGKC